MGRGEGGWGGRIKKKNLPPSNFFLLRHHKKFQPSSSKRSKVIHERSLPRDRQTHTQTDRRHPPCRIIVRNGIVNSVADKKWVYLGGCFRLFQGCDSFLRDHPC